MQIKPADFQNINELSEGFDLEAKAALGRAGTGTIPRSLWESYSAFSNSGGGWILLGAKETPEGLEAVGLASPDKLLRDFWNQINNRQIISANLLTDDDVKVFDEPGGKVLAICVPRAGRRERPIYVGANPLEGTYKRNHEGDYRCTLAEVRRMLAEADEIPRDAAELEGFGLEDFSPETIRAFRGMVQAVQPGHPFLQGDDTHLLLSLGALHRNRASGAISATRGGLWLFGVHQALQEAFPRFFLDYREVSELDASTWEDRVCSDGTWSGNILDFYRRVYPRLVADLKVPFRQAADGQRTDDTATHRALREALANTLSHADYEAETSAVVLKQPGRFTFTNPGRLRQPLDVVLRGGVSDPRNVTLHKAFILIGVAERAGSGVPRILQAWKQQHWRRPRLIEHNQPEHTELVLETASLLPDDSIHTLEQQLGLAVDRLEPSTRIILCAALEEGEVNHAALTQLVPDVHPRDLTLQLQSLVRQELLTKRGAGRGTFYRLNKHPRQMALGQVTAGREAGQEGARSEHKATRSEHKATSSVHKDSSSEHKDSSSEHKPPQAGAGSEHNAPSSVHKGASSVHLKSQPDAGSQHRDPSSQHKTTRVGSNSQHKEASSQHPEASSQHKGSHAAPGSQHKGSSFQHKDLSSVHMDPQARASSEHEGSNSVRLELQSDANSVHKGSNSVHLRAQSDTSSEHEGSSSVHMDGEQPCDREAQGLEEGPSSSHGITRGRIPEDVDILSRVGRDDRERLICIAQTVAKKGKVRDRSVLRETILALCEIRPLTIEQLAELLHRKPFTLRVHYLTPLVSEGALRYLYPDRPTHPQQAYITVTPDSPEEPA